MPGITNDGGAEQSFLSMVPGFIAKGIEVHLVVLTDRQGPVTLLEREGVVVHDLSRHRSFAGRARAIRKLVRGLRPDLVHASLYEATLPAQIAVVGTGTPVLVSWTITSYSQEHFTELGMSRWKLRIVQVLDGLAGRVSRTRYHAVTAGVARVNATSLRVDPSRVQIGERGREWERYAPCTFGSSPVLSDVPAGAKLVLTIGRQDPAKGHETLLEAFDQVVERVPEAFLLVAGRPGPATPALQLRVAALRHADRVRFIGARLDVPELLAAADVVVCSSWREGAAGALIEAMAAGTPIVSVDLVGLEGVLVNRRNAIVVQRAELADGIVSLLRSPELAIQIAEGGRETFAERFTLERSVARMIEIFESSISSPEERERALTGARAQGRRPPSRD